MINFFKKHWLLILLAMLATFLAGLWILKPFLGERVDESLPKLKKIEFEGVSLNPQTRISLNIQTNQKKLPVLNLESKLPLTIVEMNRIAQGLGFSEEPRIEDSVNYGAIYIWGRDEHFLSIAPQTNEIEYTLDLIANPPAQMGSLPSPEVAKGKLLALFDNLGISFDGIELVQKERYLVVSGLEIKETTLSRATILELNLNPVLGGILIVASSSNTKIVAEFDRKGEILTFKAKNSIGGLAPGQEYHLKNLEEIKQTIHSEGKILQAEVERHGKTVEDVYITSIQITQAALAYFFTEEADILQPIYILRGTAFASGVQQFPITIYLPAIKSQYFK